MKYKHALFLNPYIESTATSIMGLFPPTGLEYVATSAKDLVSKLTLLDLRYEKELSNTDKLLDFISKEIDIICVGIAWNRQFKEICDLLNLMPDNIPLDVGGYKATEEAKELFQICPKVDIIVRGEGEETSLELVEAIESYYGGGLPFDVLLTIKGLSFRYDGKVIHNEARGVIEDLDRIPFPVRDPLDKILEMGGHAMPLLCISRGCPANCSFCSTPRFYERVWRARSAKNVVDEIQSIIDKYGFKNAKLI